MTRDELRRHHLSKCPIPYAGITGPRMMIYQDEGDQRWGEAYGAKGKIIIPGSTAPNAGRGTVVVVGDGFLAHDWYSHDPEKFRAVCPYKPGDRVLWPIYDDIVVEFPCHQDTCDDVKGLSDEDRLVQRKAGREFHRSFALIEIDRCKVYMYAPLDEEGENEPRRGVDLGG